MPWFLILTWIGVIAAVCAGVFAVYKLVRDPLRYVTKIRTNALQALGVLTLASVFLSMLAGQHDTLEKLAFIVAFAIATRYLAFGLLFAGLFEPRQGRVFMTRVDLNLTFLLLMVVAVMYAAFSFVGVTQFADHAIEPIGTAIVIGFITLAEAYAKRDLSEDEWDTVGKFVDRADGDDEA